MTAGILGVIKIVSTVRGFILFAFLCLREISCQIGMDVEIVNILKDKVASEWKIFAFCTGFNDVAAIVDQIDHAVDIDQKGQDDLIKEKSKIKHFLKKLYEQHPNDYRTCIQDSLKVMRRNDVLHDIDFLGVMDDIPGKTVVNQSVVDFQEADNNLPNVTEPKNLPSSSLDHEDANERVRKILVEQVSSDWMRFAHIICINVFYNIVEEIDNRNVDNQLKLEMFLQTINEINPLNFNEVIANCLYSLKRFDILSFVASYGNDLTIKHILVENVSADWKRLACYTYLHDINSIVEQIDHGYSNDQSKMSAFLDKLHEVDHLNHKELIVNSLFIAGRFDVLFRLALVESAEIVMKLLVEQASSDWKSFAFHACLYEANCIIENIDQENNSNKMKMKALLEKLFDINPLQFKELIKSTLIIMKRFRVLSELEEDDCHGKEKEENEKLKENTNEEPVLVNSTGAKVKNIIIEKVTDWKRFARLTICSDNMNAIVEQIDHDVTGGDKSKVKRFLTKLVELHPNDYITYIQKSLKAMGRNDLHQDIASIYAEQHRNEMHGPLKKFYQTTYGKIDQLEHNVISPTNVDLLNKFVELTVVDSNDAERDALNIAEREFFLRRQSNYKPIKFYELFSKELPLILISGIAGIGKTCLLRKCLVDWANGTLWKTMDFVIYLECRKLNQYQNISSINELLNVFYKDIFQESDVCNHFSILFVIDGLDEFAYLDELINHNPLNPSKQPIVNVLADVLDFHKYKCVVAGRVGAILQYKNKMTECSEKLTIQIMGFNDYGINEYVERVGNAKEAIKNVLKSSHIAKAMASVPFYLSTMCTIIGSPIFSDSYSFFSTTELYCCIFIYFLQKHINRNKEPVYKLMEKESSKQYISKVCKVAFHLFNEGKVVFSEKEIKVLIDDIDKIENDDLGFIEKVESQLGHQYQFVHLTLMEFCASIHAHINLGSKEILTNQKLRSCLPMICGLKNEKGGPFLRLLANLRASKEESISMLVKLQRIFSLRTPLLHAGLINEHKMFIECFFEAQASITESMKNSIDKRYWNIRNIDEKNAREVLYEKYFMEKYFDAGCKLNELRVRKKILSEDEKKLIILCSTNVRYVVLYHPVKIDGWTPTHKIESLEIISDTLVSKNEFEGFVLPWIRLAGSLYLRLHDDTNFIDDICEWLRGSIFKIEYRGRSFNNIEELKNLKRCEILLIV